MNKIIYHKEELYQQMKKTKDTIILKSIIKMDDTMERKYTDKDKIAYTMKKTTI